MDIQQFTRRLRELEGSLSDRVSRKRGTGRAQTLQEPGDAGDVSVADEAKDESFTEADADALQLQEVRDALIRIEGGTFGRCVVDGEAIEPQRLEAQPWTPFCLKHQARREKGSRPKPTL
jgi:DnaK suppressor protein